MPPRAGERDLLGRQQRRSERNTNSAGQSNRITAKGETNNFVFVFFSFPKQKQIPRRQINELRVFSSAVHWHLYANEAAAQIGPVGAVYGSAE